jgi:hypothetical protein
MALMMNHLGNKIRMENKEWSNSLFLILIGKRGQLKKSSSVVDSINYLKSIGVVDYATATTRNSEGKSIIWDAGSPEGMGLDARRINAKNIVLFYDELQGLIAKAGIENSTLATTLLKIYESGFFSNSVKSRKETFTFEPGSYTASLLACTTDRMFKSLWARLCGSGSGLNDRASFLLQPEVLKKPVPFTAVNTAAGAIETRKRIDRAIEIGTFPVEDSSPFVDFLAELGPNQDRTEIRAEKYSLWFAVDLGRDCVDLDCVERGIALARYEQAVKKRLRPYEAENRDAMVQQKIIEVLENGLGSVPLRELEHKVHAERLGTDVWSRAFGGLVKSGRIRQHWSGKYHDPKVIQLLRVSDNDDDD